MEVIMAEDSIRAIIGDGLLTELMISTAVKQSNINPAVFYVYSKDENRRKQLREQYNVHTMDNLNELSKAEVVVLALYPDEAEQIVNQIKNKVADDALIISNVYGMSIAKLEKYFPKQAVIRITTTPFIVSGAGLCSYVVGSVHKTDGEVIAQMMLSNIGKIIKVKSEKEFELINEIFFAETISAYYTINGMIEGAISAGLSVDISREIASQIFDGAAKTLASPDSVIEHLVEKANKDKRQSEILKEGQKIIDKYKMWNFIKRSFDDNSQNSKLLRFHYHW